MNVDIHTILIISLFGLFFVQHIELNDLRKCCQKLIENNDLLADYLESKSNQGRGNNDVN